MPNPAYKGPWKRKVRIHTTNKSLNKLLKLIIMIIELRCYPDTAENQEPQL